MKGFPRRSASLLAYFFSSDRPTVTERPAKLVLIERIATIEDAEAEAILPIVEASLAGLKGDPSPGGAGEAGDQDSDELSEQS